MWLSVRRWRLGQGRSWPCLAWLPMVVQGEACPCRGHLRLHRQRRVRGLWALELHASRAQLLLHREGQGWSRPCLQHGSLGGSARRQLWRGLSKSRFACEELQSDSSEPGYRHSWLILDVVVWTDGSPPTSYDLAIPLQEPMIRDLEHWIGAR